jgi:predicted O-methyltransferase YrrM
MAAKSSAEYVQSQIKTAMIFEKREFLWSYALSKVNINGLFLEFGVFSGASINFFAKTAASRNQKIFGFDSFEGLKEDWFGTPVKRGTFNLQGKLPKVSSNVTLIKGWFDHTLPIFLHENKENISFVHFDADTFESTELALELLKDRLIVGTVIIFDEYLGFPNWRNGEYLAWQQFVQKYELDYRYLGFSTCQAAILVTGRRVDLLSISQ